MFDSLNIAPVAVGVFQRTITDMNDADSRHTRHSESIPSGLLPVPPEIPTWGTMVAGSQQYADRAFWVVLFPGLAIIFTALSLQLLGDGVRDLLDPKLKKAA